jgi:isovaleryl-CoA dehydrogenase
MSAGGTPTRLTHRIILFILSAHKEMNTLFLSETVQELRERVSEIVRSDLEPHSDEIDRNGQWPEQAIRALQSAGFMGLHVPKSLGGHEQGLVALTAICETLAGSCPSTAICYGMHCVATAVIAAKATPYQKENYLRPIAEGKHLTTLSLSESGTGSHFYLSQTELRHEGDSYIVTGEKQFVTNGGRADSYVISTEASTRTAEAGEFSCVIVDRDRPGLHWGPPWLGMGMRGNHSRSLKLSHVRIPTANLLGSEGDEIAYIFEVVAPYFLCAMSATYLGIAQAALDIVSAHLCSRSFPLSGDTLADAPVVQLQLSELWIAVQKTRLLIYEAARLGDLGDSRAVPYLLAAKADVADTVETVTNRAMTLAGGIAYRENSRLARLLRDGRAGHVMSPTTNILKLWLGRSLLDLPLL